jgi:hypothetical protein
MNDMLGISAAPLGLNLREQPDPQGVAPGLKSRRTFGPQLLIRCSTKRAILMISDHSFTAIIGITTISYAMVFLSPVVP